MASRVLRILKLTEYCLLLVTLTLCVIAFIQDYNYWADNTIVYNPPTVAPMEVKLAMRYHGILTCTYIEGEGYTFERNGKTYNLFDYKMFPKLKPLIESIKE